MLPAGNRTPWDSHDWKVKTLESLTAGGGSRLAFTCRSCDRRFCYMTRNNQVWAMSNEGRALTDEVTSLWLSQNCSGRVSEGDAQHRMQFKYPQ